MRFSQPMVAGAAAATVLALSVAGCGGNKAPSPTKSGSATSSTSASAPTSSASSAPVQPNDYSGWLIQASDIDAPLPFTGATCSIDSTLQAMLVGTGSSLCQDALSIINYGFALLVNNTNEPDSCGSIAPALRSQPAPV